MVGSPGVPSNHVVMFENTGGASANVLALKVAAGLPDKSNNYVTFLDGSNGIRGRIEGQNAGDLLTSAEYILFTTLALADITIGAAYLIGAVSHFPPVPLQVAAALVEVGLAATNEIAYQAFLFGNLGVAYESGSGDYAEWLPRLDENEPIEAGDIIGVFGGKITKHTNGAQQILPVSFAPIVLGNMPPLGSEHLYEKVGFLGQVQVKVIGVVREGDYIIPSGLNDGTGIAVSPEMMTADEFTKVVGRAWSASNVKHEKLINLAVGLNAGDVSTIIKKLELDNQELKSELRELSKRVGAIEAMFQSEESTEILR